MEYDRIVTLKNGAQCRLRNGTFSDGQAVLDHFNLTHEETDFLLTYPEENCFDAAQESQFLQAKTESEREIELIAVVDQTVVGTAGITAVGDKIKLRHRAEFGVSVARAYWGLGIGRALTTACVECAKKAGYTQLELDVVADNASAVSLYKKAGFVEYGRNPKGFRTRAGNYQALIHMRLEL